VAKLVVMDFMLIHGNDWFIEPIGQATGTGLRIDPLTVTDVFGGTVLVPRADEAQRRWTLYTSATADDPATTVPRLVRMPSTGSALQVADPIEEVRFFRDDTASPVWAVDGEDQRGCRDQGDVNAGSTRPARYGTAQPPSTTDHPRPGSATSATVNDVALG
jgi:hypothetical protein